MEIAREIVDEVYREQEKIRETFGVELEKPTVEGIIAARLEPAGEAIREYMSLMGSEIYDALKLPAAKAKLEAVLGLFEEK